MFTELLAKIFGISMSKEMPMKRIFLRGSCNGSGAGGELEVDV
jgi:hypothetical protein